MPHEVHVSERRSFRGCRRRWDWAYREGYRPNSPAKPLEFGIAFHLGFEAFYDPDTWKTTTPDQKLYNATKAFTDECEKQKANFLSLENITRLDEEIEADYAERITLGKGMLRYHADYIHHEFDKWFKPVATEISFEVPIIDPDDPSGNSFLRCTNSPACGQTHSNDTNDSDSQVVYAGRVDMLVEDIRYGGYFIWDHKFCTLETRILTPTGWTTHGEIRQGDYVVGSDGKRTLVTGVYPKGEKVVWEVRFSDGTVVECGDEHPFIVQYRYNGLVTKKLTAREIRDLPKYLQGKVWVPKIKPVEFDVPTKLPVDPYALGSLIGDGTLSNRSTLAFASKSGETVELLRQVLPEGMFINKDKGEYFGWTIGGKPNHWREGLRELGLWGKKSADKFIPQDYLFSSIDDRVALLQGLMDTDGDTAKYRFSTMSEQLANDFCHLVWSLGGTASKAKNCDGLWKVTFQVAFECHRLTRKKNGKVKSTYETHRTIVEVRETERTSPMLCISVDAPDHLYATENFILTHNTAAQLASDDGFLQLDDQVGSYCWALSLQLGLNIRGFIYAETRKDFPKPPAALKKPYKGCSFSTSKTQGTTFDVYMPHVKSHDPIAYREGKYDDFLAYLKSSEATLFHQRFVLTKSTRELQEIGRNISLESADMVDSHLRVYPSVGRFTCSTCAFREPCINTNLGEDTLYALDANYVKTSERYYHTAPINSDKVNK